MSQFGALTTALAATIGTGNIVGVATAVASGGPGAVLWMWLTGVFGIATKYAEALLVGEVPRDRPPTARWRAVRCTCSSAACGSKPLGVLFAALTAVSAFGIGNMVQANSIATLVAATPSASRPGSPARSMTALTALVILGGIQSIARGVRAARAVHGDLLRRRLPDHPGAERGGDPGDGRADRESAFTGQAAVGGFLGAGVREAMRYGVARGLFSNESGLGSAPIVAAAAQTKNPVRQALVSSTGTFWDTVVVCLMTGLVVVQSGEWMQGLGGAALTSRGVRRSAGRRSDRAHRSAS